MDLNASKTHIMTQFETQHRQTHSSQRASTDINCQRRQLNSDPDVVIHSRMTMADHVVSVCRSAYYMYHLLYIRHIMRPLSKDAEKTGTGAHLQ